MAALPDDPVDVCVDLLVDNTTIMLFLEEKTKLFEIKNMVQAILGIRAEILQLKLRRINAPPTTEQEEWVDLQDDQQVLGDLGIKVNINTPLRPAIIKVLFG